MPSLIKYIREHVNAQDYYTDMFPDVKWRSGNEARVLSPFTDEKTPSFSINKLNGKWHSFCRDDKGGGNSIVSFQAAIDDTTQKVAARKIFHEYLHPTIPKRRIRSWVKQLRGCPSVLKYLRNRFISDEIIKIHNLGWNGRRITIPILNEFKICINAKLYDPDPAPHMAKMLNYSHAKEERSFGSPTMLFPMSSLNSGKGYIVICEGEWDVLCLLSMGIPAITTSAGARSWPSRYNKLFKGLDVIIIPDNNDAGNEYLELVKKNLASYAKTIKVIKLPAKYGVDVNDHVRKRKVMQRKASWLKLIKKATPIIVNEEQEPESVVHAVPLDNASSAEWFNKQIKVKTLITGKGIAPYLLPKKFRLKCDGTCDECDVAASGKTLADHTVDPSDPYILDMIDRTKPKLRKMLLSCAGVEFPSKCAAKIEILETLNLEYLLMIPTIDSKTKQYVTRFGFYHGHGLYANRAYEMKGIIAPNPKDQIATFLFSEAAPIQNEIETFQLSGELKDALRIFRPNQLNHFAHIMNIAEWQSRNITKIFRRSDLHIAIDLAYHSVPSFTFNRENIPRGMIDMLVLGDTRCGKGFVTERLQKYYGLGEIASGENCSFAGLVGGVQQINGRWLITWGLIPLNNKRLVVIDEVSSLSVDDIGKMSRIRSEGVAEINKIIRESTQANTRLIWLANPRSGRPIITYNTGVEAVKELIGANEDISRFDFAITVAANEVETEIINSIAEYDTSDSDKYSPELCRSLLLWIWSRENDQIKFTDSATTAIIKVSRELGNTYSSTIPLIQIENIRIKVAKIAAAIAGRTFSTDASCENIIVNSKHVRCAEQFLQHIYTKNSMGYDMFSKTTIAASQIEDKELIEKILKRMAYDEKSSVTGLIELQQISPDNLSDYTGDLMSAKILIGELVRARCLVRYEKQSWYMKNPAFASWLKDYKKKKGY